MPSTLGSPTPPRGRSANIGAPGGWRDILRIGKRHGERPDSGTSRLICRGCESALIPGRTARTRITGGMLVITCENCGRIERSGPDFSGGDSD